jgi:phage-related protein
MATTVRNVLVRLGVSERGWSRGWRAATRDVQRFQRDANGRLHDLNGRFVAEGRTAGESYGTSFRTSALKSLLKLTKLTRGFRVMVKTAAAVGALSALSGAAASSALSLIHLAAAVAPLGGLLAAIPGAVGLAAVALGTLKLATSGMGDAFKAALQGPAGQDKFDKALEQLSPAARGAAIEFKKLVPVLHSIRDAAQAGFWGPLRGEMTKTAKVLAGPLKTGFKAVAQQIGSAAVDVMRFVREARTVAAIQSVFESTRSGIAGIRPALEPLLAGFRDLAAVGAKFLAGLAPAIGQAAAQFGRFLSAASASGKATQWLQNGLAALKSIGTVLGNVGGILGSVFRVANQGGGNLLGTFGQLTGALNTFLKSTDGVAALRAVFAGIGQIGKALGPVVIALAKGLGQIAPAIGRIATFVGPILTKAINALAPALAKLEPGITALINGLGSAFSALGPVLPAVATALAGIATSLAPILPALGNLIAMLAGGLASTITQLVSSGALDQLVYAIKTLGYQLGYALLNALVAVTPYLPDLVTSLAQLLIALTPVIPELAKAAPALVPLVPVLTDAIRLLTELTDEVLPPVIFFIQSNIDVTKAFVKVTQWAWGLIRNVIQTQVGMVGTAISWFGTLPAKFHGWFVGAYNGAKSALGWLTTMIGNLPYMIAGVFKDAGKWLYTAGRNILVGLWNGIASMASWIARSVGNLIRDIIPGPVRKVLGIASPSKVFAGFGRNLGEGLVLGMQATQGIVASAAASLAGAAVPAMAGPAVAGPGLPQPRGALRTGDRQQPAIDYRQLAATLAGELKRAGLGAIYLDGKEIANNTSRHQGQNVQQRRRSG